MIISWGEVDDQIMQVALLGQCGPEAEKAAQGIPDAFQLTNVAIPIHLATMKHSTITR